MSQHRESRGARKGMGLVLAVGVLGTVGCTGEEDPQEPAGTCQTAWRQDYQGGSSSADEALSIWAGSSGAVYVAGYDRGNLGQTNIEPSGNSRAVVLRFLPNGTLDRTEITDTGGTDVAEHITGSETQELLTVVGRTTGALENATNRGQFDLFVTQLDGKGNKQRTVQQGDERPQHPMKVAVHPNGSVFVAGFDDMFVQGRVVLDSENGFVTRINREGNGFASTAAWKFASTLASNPDRLTGFATSPNADALYSSGFKFFADSEGPGGAFVRRHDPANGSAVWTTAIAPVATEADELLVTPDNKLLLAGSSMLPLEEGVPIAGEVDVFLAQLNPGDGQVQWIRTVGTQGSEQTTALARAPNGDIYVAGSTLGAFPGFTHQGARDLFVLRFSADGRLLGTLQRGTSGNDQATALWVDPCGRVFIAGYTEGALVPGIQHQGSRDMFLLKVDVPQLQTPPL
ncbi:hypothetical protein OV208_20895 [Corallococcus sp. bb12-1]|uniref:hypothetical protein n=1 Tax=Corallococcus sp. bb12-1 TaxID=2996784 RepID=UPI00226EEB19|nr:hypothetical protein [Corallococcus sp. bb12-1]MCY1043790.1 hypothetical protein [Corallococcus sp. bb12-1]